MKTNPNSISILVFFLTLVSCQKDATPTVVPCDLVSQELNCSEPGKEFSTIVLPKNLRSWEEIGNWLYFQNRSTPGILVEWPRDLDIPEAGLAQKNFLAEIKLGETTQKMEGLRANSYKMSSFHYLGTLVKAEMERKNILTERPKSFEPIKVDIFVSSDSLQLTKLSRTIQLEWEP